MSIAIELEIAERTLHRINRENETRYIVRRPSLSLKEDHHNGNIAMLSIYRATDKLVTVGSASKVLDTWLSAAVQQWSVHSLCFKIGGVHERKKIALPIGAAIAATAMMNVMNHLVFRG